MAKEQEQVQVLGKSYCIDVPTTIYPEYFSFMDEEDTTDTDIADFARALREYTRGNFDYKSENRYVRAELRQIRASIKLRREKYISAYTKRKEASSAGGKTTAENRKNAAKSQNAENEDFNLAPLQHHFSTTQVEKENKKENKKKSPLPPTEAASGGGEGFKFLLFLQEYARITDYIAGVNLPRGATDRDADRAAWQMTDRQQQPRIAIAVQQNDLAALQQACSKAPANGWTWQMWKAVQAVAAITDKDLQNVSGVDSIDKFRQVIAGDANKHHADGDIYWQRLQKKIEYIKQGAEIRNLASFMAAVK